MQVSVTISGFTRLFDNDIAKVIDAAKVIDDSGVHQLVLADHVVMGDRTDRYPFGTFPYPSAEPWPEPLTLLAAIAAVTDHVRLGTGILIAPLRAPALLAKTVATLDQISNGRVDLGVGTGWQREEYAACSVPWASRWQRLDDTMRACAALWTTPGPVQFASETVSFDAVWCNPMPVQQVADSAIPIWYGIAASGEHIDRMAELGAGWLPIHTTTAEELREGIRALRAAVAARGRDPKAFHVRAGAKPVMGENGHLDIGATQAENAWLAAAGVDSVSIGTGRHVGDAASLRTFLSAAVEAFAGLSP